MGQLWGATILHAFGRSLLHLLDAETRAASVAAFTYGLIKLRRLRPGKVFFMHLPKTGGTTVTNYVARQIGAERCCPVKEGGASTDRALFQHDFVSGHFDLPVVTAARDQGYATALQLRDPLERLTSSYNFLRSYSDAHPHFTEGSAAWLAQTLPIDQFFSAMRGNGGFDNLCVRMLAGHPTFTPPTRRVEIGQADYEKAVDNLHRFDLVGFTHQQRRLINGILTRLGGWPVFTMIPKNVTANLAGTTSWVKQAALVSSSKLPAMCQDLIRYDRMLFAHAQEHFGG